MYGLLKRIFCGVLVIIFLLAALSGCSGAKQDMGKDKKEPEVQTPKDGNKEGSNTQGNSQEKKQEPGQEQEPKQLPPAVTANVDRSVKYQEIEGFGFFGGRDVWWGSDSPSHFYNDEWLTMILDDLGVTMWRNELYPNNPVDSDKSTERQDANWSKQKPLVQALKAKADELGVPLKYILTVWTPPGEWKLNSQMAWAGDEKAVREGAHNSTKNGGTLDPLKYGAYADWLTKALDMYKNAGVDVYGLSLQNEPAFSQSFNSCTYTTYWYTDLLKNVVPRVKDKYPQVKIFGSEHMLKNEAASEDYQWFYHMAIKKDEEALKNLDVFAVHGYTNGVQAEAIANHRDYWTRTREQFSEPSGKPYWMTETSGYNEFWRGGGGKSGAFDLGIAIHAALYYGRASAWVWWQGSELGGGIGEYALMNGTNRGKKYYVSKQFYRFIRPGSRMVDMKLQDNEILACAFENDKLDNFVVVLINTSDSDKVIKLDGENIPDTFQHYRTSGAVGEDCSLIGDTGKDSIVLAPYSINTLVSGSFKEK